MLDSGGVARGQAYTAIHFRHGGNVIGDGVLSRLDDAQRFHRLTTSLKP